jgi:superfamily II DNA or RNA helicase
MIEEREFQTITIDKARNAVASGLKKIIIQASTGSGKTVMAARITQSAREKNKKVLFLANRRELIFQAKKTLEFAGLNCGLVMAGEIPNHDADIQVASMQTYVRRMDLDELQFNRWWHDADLIFVDECHSSISPTYQKILKAYDDKKIVIGLTATPCRGDGRGLGEYYEQIISAIGTQELIDLKYLVPPRYFVPPTDLDLTNMGSLVMNDWNKKTLGERVNKPKLIGDIYHNWASICPTRSTIIFATNVKHSIAIEKTFLSHDVTAKHIDAHTPYEERAQAFEDFESGRLQVIVNVGVACEGTDLPIASCIVLARPTKSLGKYIQMCGRGARIYPGKHDFFVLDHARCLEEHGRLEAPIEWTLDGKEIAWKKTEPIKKEKQPVVCPACNRVMFEGETVCPDCGTGVVRFGKDIEVEDGNLSEISTEKATIIEKRKFYGQLLGFQIMKREHGKFYNDGWVAHKYKDKFGVWPRGMSDVVPIVPDKAFINWITYQNIRYAKQKAKEKEL